ncbi:LysE family translocator [Brevundimonas bacteroides]|uniref:LysE family translocator n=1 Tax=Brevundimonas bacteroides TaxID=74311 RepID=UPI0004961A67|nr:LysE family translocator [Brevundimonas bacteroides]
MPHDLWPVDPSVVLPFLVAVLLIELTPGPNMGWLALVSMAQGRLAGLAAVAGVTLGLAVWMVLAAVGLTSVLLAFPALYQAVRWAGVIFLLWLAWEAWAGAGKAAEDMSRDPEKLRGLFLRGLTGNLLNPKAAVFYVALLPTFIRPDHASAMAQALTLGSLHLIVSVLVHGAIVLGAAAAGAVVMRRLRGLWAGRAMAAGIAAVAVWMAWATRS